MRQPAPIKGERMESLLAQAIVDNTPISEDAPSRPDHRTEQHITVDLPDSVRHSSDSSHYLINRNAPIGSQAVKMSDIEADNYDIKMVDGYLSSALSDMEPWAYVRELQMKERSEAQVPVTGIDEDNVDKSETAHEEIVQCLANLRFVSKHQNKISQLILELMEDVENNKFRRISEAMLAHFLITQQPSDQVSGDA
ncbi:hypothetical protein DID88_002625 [Monilinia fructigena]|uniref:Uncharacterized protein n=1 Tax=Monilinia fructigena TaxID=38457 RepID=A0A395IPS0_9HELO|nr:hypothetical protein DID88_002625 [Monilinia fructigena]